MPGRARAILTCAEQDGRLDILVDDIEVGVADVDGVVLTTRSRRLRADEVWLATGFDTDWDDPLVTAMQGEVPSAVESGFPLVEPDLRWPGSPVWLAGIFALPVVGPTAANFHGQGWAAQIIAASVVRRRTSSRCEIATAS